MSELPIPYEKFVEQSNACFRKTLEDSEETDAILQKIVDENLMLSERRRRIFSETWFFYNGKSLLVLTHKDRCFVMLIEDSDTQESYVVIDIITSEPDVKISFELSNGQVDEYKKFHTTSASIAFEVMEHFVKTGEKLPSVSWVNGSNIS